MWGEGGGASENNAFPDYARPVWRGFARARVRVVGGGDGGTGCPGGTVYHSISLERQ